MPRSANPVPQYFDDDNKILSGGKVFYFNAGGSTPKTTYSDEAETIANPNPVILDAAGRLPNVFFTGTAKQVLKDLNDVQIWERDNVGSVEQISDFNSYNLNISYDAGDIVKFNGLFFISLQNSNQNNQPDASLTFWAEIRFIEVYNTNVDYPLGLVVQTSNGNMWKSVNSPNQGNDPSVDDGTNWKSSIGGSLTLDNLEVTGLSALNTVTANDLDSVLLKRAASTVYARDDIIGTVTESLGVPTGAILEVGSNGNGDFIKYADGTLTCNIKYFTIASGGQTWTYPHAFVTSDPTITPSISANSGSPFGAGLMSESYATNTTTTNIIVYDTSGVKPTAATINAIAIGRWF